MCGVDACFAPGDPLTVIRPMSDRVLNFLLQVGCNLEASARSLTGSFLSETLRKPTYDRSHVYSGSEWPGFLHPLPATPS